MEYGVEGGGVEGSGGAGGGCRMAWDPSRLFHGGSEMEPTTVPWKDGSGGGGSFMKGQEGLRLLREGVEVRLSGKGDKCLSFRKVVLKLDFVDEKIKRKVMKSASHVSGVESISLDPKDKKLTVIGDVDPVALVAKLRKLCHTEIVSVGPAKEPEKKKDEPKKEGPKDQPKEDDDAQLRKAIEAHNQQLRAHNQQLQHHYYDLKSVSEQEIESTPYGEIRKNSIGEILFKLSEGSKRAPNRTLDPVEGNDQDAARASISAVELQRKNDDLRNTTADLNYDQISASEQEIESTSYGEIQELVLKMDFSDEKIMRKAMRRVSGVSGVESVRLDPKDKKLTVIGDVDPVALVAKLMKLCRTEIVSVGPAKEPEKQGTGSDYSSRKLEYSSSEISFFSDENYDQKSVSEVSEMTTTADLDFLSFSDENYDQKSASEQEIESTSYGEIKVVSEMTSTGIKNFLVWKRDVEFTSSNAEKSMHHQATGFIASKIVLQEKHYLVSMKDDRIKLKLDHQIILIEDCRPSKPPEGSNVEPVLNLVEQDFRELPEKSSYHNALFLFLQRNYRLSRIHSSFFDSMPELRFLDLSDTRIRILPSSLFRLSKLNVLMLRNCVSLENLPSEIRELNQIEVLDLAGTELYNLPNEIGQLTLLKHMQLSFYGPDDESEYDHLPSQLVSPSILSELKELRALSITVHPDDNRWKTDASCIMKDVGKLEMLTYLQLYFPELEMFELFIQTSPSWEKHKLSNFYFIVGHNVKRIASRVPDEVESLFDQQDKCFRFVNGDRVTQVIKNVLIQVTALYLDHHIGIQSLSEFGITNFRVLKFCVLRECPRIQAIVDEKREEGTFPCLEHLRVYYLWDLKHIWKPSSGPGRFKRIWKTSLACVNFKALKHLTVNTCPKLQFVLWESMLQSISNLEELVVEDCESVEKIIKEEKKKVKHDDVMLPRLRKLELHYLPELVSLGNGLSLPEEIIRVYGCPKLVLKSSKFPVS